MPDFSNTLYSVNLFSFFFFNCQLRLLEPKYFNIEEMCSPPVFFFLKRKTFLALNHTVFCTSGVTSYG